MKVGVLTYQTRHLKTEQLLAVLSLDSSLSLSLYGLPFVQRPQRTVLFNHRPDMALGATPEAMARHYEIPYQPVTGVEEIPKDLDVCVVGGAGLLPPEFVRRIPVVNCHPGLQPAVRGLDAFKWAIHDSMLLGASLHILDEQVDAGTHLKSVRTPVYAGDSLESVARRHYELEIALLGTFRRFFERPEPTLEGLKERPARKRMLVKTEKAMIAGFDEYKRMFPIDSGST